MKTKCIILLLLSLFVFQSVDAQITTLDSNFKPDIEKLKEKEEVVIPYDSTYNFLKYRPNIDKYGRIAFSGGKKNDFVAYIGQKIFIPTDLVRGFKMDEQFFYNPSGYYTIINIEPENKEYISSRYRYIRKYRDSIESIVRGREIVSINNYNFKREDLLGYESFINLRLKIDDLRNKYRNKVADWWGADSMIYKEDGTLVYKDSLGKHYKDLYKRLPDFEAYSYRFIELLSETGDTLYVKNMNNNNYSTTIMPAPIPVGYFEKVKELFENKDFYYVGSGDYTDFYTKEKIKLTRTSYDDYKKGKTEPYKVTNISLYNNDIVATMEGKNSKFLVYIGYRIYIWDSSSGDYSFYYGDWGRNPTFSRFILASEYKFKADLEKNRDAKKEQDRLKAQEAVKKKEQLRITKLVEKYGKDKGTIIANGKVSIGMTKEMCKEAWGTPFKTVTKQNSLEITEVWIYGANSKLYFRNNTLVEILSSK